MLMKIVYLLYYKNFDLLLSKVRLEPMVRLVRLFTELEERMYQS